ncbi:NTP transferase domain-containing protein [Nocardioidaceae bacterium]|nr:NTP transferase domain-containing protein [Nocardioidaceae bacterium]
MGHETSESAYDLVVLAGGGGERLGGRDKALLERDGRTLLDRLLAELDHARDVVVVGPRRDGDRDVAWAREDPAGGGPAAGLVAGLRALAPGGDGLPVLVVAVDMAYVDAGTASRLAAAMRDGAPDGQADGQADGAALVDDAGRRQLCLLLGAAAAEQLTRPSDPAGLSMGGLLDDLTLVDVPAQAEESTDIDTPEDLARLH